MWRNLKLHEAFIRSALAGELGEVPWAELRDFHEQQLRFMQHERLIHLIVILFVATFFLLTTGFVMLHTSWAGAALAGLLLILLSAYLVHYFRLENGVQRWYVLSNRLTEKLGRVGADYEGGTTRIFGQSEPLAEK